MDVDQVLSDLRAVRAEVDRRGWVSGSLLDWTKEEPGEDDSDLLPITDPIVKEASVCMTGAIGAAIDGADFLEFAVRYPHDMPLEWEYSPRARAVINALTDHHPLPKKAVDDSVASVCSEAGTPQWNVEWIVSINDDFGKNGKRKALAWIDKTIKALEAKRAKAAVKTVKKPRVVHEKRKSAVKAQQKVPEVVL